MAIQFVNTKDKVKKMADLIRVNLTNNTVTREPVPENYALLGGRGLR